MNAINYLPFLNLSYHISDKENQERVNSPSLSDEGSIKKIYSVSRIRRLQFMHHCHLKWFVSELWWQSALKILKPQAHVQGV
jgi:hypothetical protein